MLLCPLRKRDDGTPQEPSSAEINKIVKDAERLAEIRRRLSDISWWMRLLCQKIGTRANAEDDQSGKFFQARFRAVKLLDEEALLACAAYVDLNPIRAAMAETLEESDFTSVQRRIQSLEGPHRVDQFLSPIWMDELTGSSSSRSCRDGQRCSDHGFLSMSLGEYLELLDWTARQTVASKSGVTPASAPPMLARLSIDATTWCELVSGFGRMFYHVAGKPQSVDDQRTRISQRRFHMRRGARELLATAS